MDQSGVVPEFGTRGGARSPRGGAEAKRFNHGMRRAGAPGFVRPESDQWTHLLRLVSAEYPYCTMHGVNIVDGNIVSCENVQQSLTFGPQEEGAAGPDEPEFDDHWTALKALCASIKTGRLVELRFSQGRPVSARKSEGGRRFRRLVTKADRA